MDQHVAIGMANGAVQPPGPRAGLRVQHDAAPDLPGRIAVTHTESVCVCAGVLRESHVLPASGEC